MNRRLFVGLSLVAAIAMGILLAGPSVVPQGPAPQSGDPAISAALATVLVRHDLPAMAGAMVTSKGLQRAGAVGWRKSGDPTPVTLDDHWHLGSDAKAMTAALIARFVERGRLRWDSTVAQILPEAGPGWDAVTLDHLLTHRSGIVTEPDYWDIPTRSDAVRIITEKPPATVPGSTFQYSNSGYVLAGAMLERIAGKPWEDLMRTELWEPLGMQGGGFGGMGTPGLIDQPWQHRGSGRVAGNGPKKDNPAVMGPAGTVHMPIQAWAAFIADQLKGARGEPALLSAASYQHLQTPPAGGEYAHGWVVVRRGWAKGMAMTHSGSNTMNMAVVWMAPAIDTAVLVCSNQGEVHAACDDAAVALIRLAGVNP